MQSIQILQRFMGGSLAICFFVHDYHYTEKFAGLSIVSIVFLLSLFWFHSVVFFLEAGIVELTDKYSKRKLDLVRLCVLMVSIVFCLADCYLQMNQYKHDIMSLKEIMSAVLSMIVIVFPETVFRIVFLIKDKSH